MAGLDHLAVVAESLDAGCAFVEEVLGVPLAPGGVHPLMGTHNRLLSLGPDEYLEVIAIDPAAAMPAHPRWFGLDGFSGAPALAAWIVQVDDLEGALTRAPEGAGDIVALSRGDLRWRMAVPASGLLPYGGVFPALISWAGAAHPAARLPDQGVRLQALQVIHPQSNALSGALAPFCDDPRVRVIAGPAAGLRAEFATPSGLRVIG